MASLGQVIFLSLIGGLFSLAGGIYLLASKKRAAALAVYATPFAAGALLAAAFIDLLPEAVDNNNPRLVLLFTLVGILGFFLLEKFIHWFHHHHEQEDNDAKSDETIPLIIVGDTLHNFIDGIVIAAGLLVNVETGIIVTVAVAVHEIPQEIGDFGLLLSKGMRRRNVLLVNIFSALSTTVAAVIFFQLGQTTTNNLGILLGLIAGFFIYIATSDIIPTLHKTKDKRLAATQTFLLILGVVLVGSATIALEDLLEPLTSNNQTTTIRVDKT